MLLVSFMCATGFTDSESKIYGLWTLAVASYLLNECEVRWQISGFLHLAVLSLLDPVK